MIEAMREIIALEFINLAMAMMPERNRIEFASTFLPLLEVWKQRSFYSMPQHLQEKYRGK